MQVTGVVLTLQQLQQVRLMAKLLLLLAALQMLLLLQQQLLEVQHL